ncbi:hypothetical protein [Oceaniradius stylonematis]|uniref:hypothetical protein n=1 Tax=Oceaniradius stylonematis TaxID=2184161 RepID=UPI00273F7C7A|nr:hypothetical protein [Oceaniradius stylonematis]
MNGTKRAGWALLGVALILPALALWFRPDHLPIIAATTAPVLTSALGLLGYAYRDRLPGRGGDT